MFSFSLNLSKKTHFALVSLIFFFVALALYAPHLDNPFMMDDEIQVTGNAHIQKFGLSDIATLLSSSTMGSGGGKSMGGIYYKPVMTVYYATIWKLFGAQPAAFRWPLLFVHVCSALLLILIARRHLSSWGAVVVGAIFLLHPVNTEVVAYIADAQDIFYLFFGLASLVLLIYSKQLRWFSMIIYGVLITLSILSKETGALFFLFGPLYLAIFERPKLKRCLAVVGGVGAIYAYARISMGFVHYEVPSLNLHRASWLERMMTVPKIVLHDLEILFFPWRISLATDYVNHELGFENFWLPVLVIVGFLASIIIVYKKTTNLGARRLQMFLAGVLIFWFGLHGQILIPLDGTYADRWLYIPTICFAFYFVMLAEFRNPISRKWMTLFIILFVAYGVRIEWRMQDWSNPLRLYTREMDLHPWDAIMTNNVGVELFRAGRIAESGSYFEKATQLNTGWDVGWSNWGAFLQRTNRQNEAFAAYSKAVSMGTYYLAYENYAALLYIRGQEEECRKFLREKALVIFPENENINRLATVLHVKK